jgi:putative transposase
VSRHRGQIDPHRLDVYRYLTEGLRRVRVEEYALFFADRANLGDRMNRADLVIRSLDRHEKGLMIDHPDQVWCSDITYIRMLYGFVYLVAIMDWYSRFVLAWEISTTLDTAFCLAALEQALGLSKPGIFNTDQGSQFTSLEFTGRLEQEGIQVSMDSRGRVFDNIFIERLWRSVKYEEVYLHQYQTVSEARALLTQYFLFYNMERLHESLGYQTPYQVYVKERLSFNPVQASTMHLIQPNFLS